MIYFSPREVDFFCVIDMDDMSRISWKFACGKAPWLTNMNALDIMGAVLLFVIGTNRLAPVHCSGFFKRNKNKMRNHE